MSEADRTSIYSWVSDLCRHRLTAENGRTLLHYCTGRRPDQLEYFRLRDTSRHMKYVILV